MIGGRGLSRLGPGVIAAAAMDQRGSLKKALQAAGDGNVGTEDIESFKAEVTEVLTRYASAILLDPEYGLPAAKRRAPDAGLLLAYEESGYDNTRPGRLPDLLPLESVRRIKEQGADAVKVLIYYTPFDKPDVNDEKHAFVERIGDECTANDIPFFLEFVGYDADGGDEKGLEYARRKPEIVMGSMEEFSKDRYGVDVLKVEVPVNMKFVEGTRAFAGEAAVFFAWRNDAALLAAGVLFPPIVAAGTYVLVGVLLPLVHGLVSMERYVILLFPVFALWATWKSKWGQSSVFALSLFLLVMATMMFSVGFSLF